MPIRRALPQQVRFFNAESSASYISRLASANGLEFAELLELIGRGRKALPVRGSAELYLNEFALARLSVLSGHPVDRLQQTLPAARAEHMLPSSRRYPAWCWLSEESRWQHLVRVCRLCSAARGIMQVVFVWSDLPWRVCLRHGTWLDSRPQHGMGAPPADAMEWVLQAHRRRLAVEKRLGQEGRHLLADAYVTLTSWKQQGLTLRRWWERGDALRDASLVPAAVSSVALYPEAVELASMLGKHKRQYLSRKAGQQLWWEILARTMGEWGAPLAWAVMSSAVRKPVQSWRDQHDPARRPLRELHPAAGRRALDELYRRVGKGQALSFNTSQILPLEKISCVQPRQGVAAQADRRTASYSAAAPWTLPAPKPAVVPPPAAVFVRTKSGERQAAAHPRAEAGGVQVPNMVVRVVQEPRAALSLRFVDPAQHTAIAAAARRERLSMQEYVPGAAYDRATGVERRFHEAF
ncbi:TniQ family protein [Streptomyces sp. NPDC058128]|uniref:TniQ family protein n=1 Tax=Streptomyces sp. NPDC058128 TaxID=3346352 RepID=UPI0036EEA128